MDRKDIIIIGGGLAGAVTAEEYRKAGGTGTVMIVSQEGSPPIHRPPLSKEYLRGDASVDKVFVHQDDFYSENSITLEVHSRVVEVDVEGKQITLANGQSISYGKLVFATGARPRKLKVPGADLEGIFYLRTLANSDRLRDAYSGAERAVIIGAGFIGMEVAASLTQKGITCSVVETGPRMWPSLVPDETANFIQRYYEVRGTKFLFGRTLTEFEGDTQVRSVLLDDGSVLPADLVVIGAGVILNTELAEQAGLKVDRGIVVNERLETSATDVYAAGDVANFPDPIGGQLHLEHWDNALEQGKTLGKILAGEALPFDHVAYFFSDMFDLSLNMIGYPIGATDTFIQGDLEKGKFTTVYLKDGLARAALMINDDAGLGNWTQAVKNSLPVDDPRLANAR